MRCANSRASMSVVAPAGNGTMMRMVLVGDQVCAMRRETEHRRCPEEAAAPDILGGASFQTSFA